ncbi:MAG TPA: hypothetical protein VMZ53_17530, partial [Kofleriaceae bacterium]|nr:hypothetical protein [Kofleriaceae bacterium]
AGIYVDVETDGRTLMIQRSAVQAEDDSLPAEARPSETQSTVELKRLASKAPEVFERLARDGIPFETFRALYHGEAEPPDPARGPVAWRLSLAPYRQWLSEDDRFEPTPEEAATMRRFEVCYEARRDRATWKEAARVALEEVPMVLATVLVPVQSVSS